MTMACSKLGYFLITLFMAVCPGIAAGGESMELTLKSTGAAHTEFRATQAQDNLHSCALLGLSNSERTLVLTYNARQAQLLLQPADFAFSLSIAGVIGAPWNEKQPSAIFQVSIAKMVFFGLRASDPAFRLDVKVDPDGTAGAFSATHLREIGADRTIDVQGGGGCETEAPADPLRLALRDSAGQISDAVTAQAPEASPTVPAKPPPHKRTRTPAPPDSGSSRSQKSDSKRDRHFRIYHSDVCRGDDCSIWTVIDRHTGNAFAATVRTSELKLSSDLREKA